MVPEDLLFWVAPIAATPHDDQSVLCRRHADAMVVPRGWTLDDRREEIPRLFMPARFDSDAPSGRPRRRSKRSNPGEAAEQLMIDGTGEIERPDRTDAPDADDGSDDHDDPPAPWSPSFDHDDDLGGLLEASSPLLSRAFRGAERRSS